MEEDQRSVALGLLSKTLGDGRFMFMSEPKTKEKEKI
jgi:hypothetical protein